MRLMARFWLTIMIMLDRRRKKAIAQTIGPAMMDLRPGVSGTNGADGILSGLPFSML